MRKRRGIICEIVVRNLKKKCLLKMNLSTRKLISLQTFQQYLIPILQRTPHLLFDLFLKYLTERAR